ncbi:immunoglobulin-like domain-containing protein [Alloscardovia venturai]|uniref:Immunoglobulin-like domain-containing protein n=1 Tax=Alloscardovia venturai TaxID=1769421 RepID=A0ABW2Y4L1_9BIFI
MMNKIRRATAWAVVVPLLLGTMPSTAIAQENTSASQDNSLQLISSWDFEGGSLTDSIGGENISLAGKAAIQKFGDRNNSEALDIVNTGNEKSFAQIPDSVITSAGNNVTIDFAAKSRSSDTRNYFTFGVGKDSARYLLFYASTQNVKLAIADNGWRHEPGFKVGAPQNDNIWHNYRISIQDDSFVLYRDGKIMGSQLHTGIKLSDLHGATTLIGKSFYSEDTYWNGAIDDIKIFRGANLPFARSVDISGDGVVSGALALVEGDKAQLKASIQPQDALEQTVKWSSSDKSVATVNADGTVTASSPGKTTIVAQVDGSDVKSELPVLVTELDAHSAAQADVDYAISQIPQTVGENLPLAVQGALHKSDLTWKSSNVKLVTGTDSSYRHSGVGADDPYKGAGIISRPAYGTGDSQPVTLTVTARRGTAIVQRSVTIRIKESGRTAPDTGYAAVTFLSDADRENGKIGEALYESATSSSRNDFFSFSQINNGEPVITSTTDTTGLRDPYVLKSHFGDTYYMIATDLKVSRQGWGENQQFGSLKIEAWQSNDMVNWTRTNAAGGSDTGITINSPNQGMTWAPEAAWDDSLGAYVVFFSSRAYTDDTRETPIAGKNGYAYNIVRYAITRDFKTFTAPTDWEDTGYSRIDSTVFKIGDYYYRLTKNEENGAAGEYVTSGKTTFLERSRCLTCTTVSSDPQADENTTWRLLDQNILPFEGAESIRLNAGDINQNDAGDAMVIMADSGGYQPFMTSQSALSNTSWSHRLSQTPGWFDTKVPGKNVTGRVSDLGMPTPKRHGAFVSVPQAVLETMHAYSSSNKISLATVNSTIGAKVNRARNSIDVTVRATDGGDIAGHVTVSINGTKRIVKLDARGKATVALPRARGNTIRIDYDGYTDGRVAPSHISIDRKGHTVVGQIDPAVIHYSFDSVKSGQTRVINEGSAKGSDAQISGSLAASHGFVSLTGSQAIEVPTSSISHSADITLSMWVKNNYGAGNVAAAYIGNRDTSHGYLLVNPQNPHGYVKAVMTTATSQMPQDGPWGSEVGPGSTGQPESGMKSSDDLTLYTVVVRGSTHQMSVYADGKLIGQPSYIIPDGGITAYKDLVAYIGKSAYADPNMSIDVYDYAIYNQALDAAQVSKLYNDQVWNQILSSVSIDREVVSDFALARGSQSMPITWSSNNAAIVIGNAAGIAHVQRPSSSGHNQKVTVTAQATVGGKTVKKAYCITVPRELTTAEKLEYDVKAIRVQGASQVRGNISVATRGTYGSSISWKVTKGVTYAKIADGVNATSKTIVVTRPRNNQHSQIVILKATASLNGKTKTKNVKLTIKPLPKAGQEDVAYVWAYFTGEGVGGEKVSLAASRGNNALDWITLNDGKPIFTSTKGEQGLRDPFILRSKDGDKFYLLATDLKISGRPNSSGGLSGFAGSQANGSAAIEI